MDAGFNQQAGPGARSPFVNFGPSPPSPSPSPFPSPRPVAARPSWSNVLMNNGAQPQRPRPPPSSNAVTSVVASRDENSVTLRISRSQHWNNPAIPGFRPSPGRANPMGQYAPQRAQVPEPVYRNAPSAQGFRPAAAGAGHVRHTVPQTFSPQPAPISNQFLEGFYPSLNDARHINAIVPPRPRSPELGHKFDQSGPSFHPSGGASLVKNAPFSHLVDGRANSQSIFANLTATRDRSSVSPNTSGFGHESNHYDGVKAIEAIDQRSAASLSDLYTPLKRPSLAHSPALGPSSIASFRTHDSQAPQRPLPRSSNILPNNVARNPTRFPATKRSRSPQMLSSNQAAKGNSDDIQDDERPSLAHSPALGPSSIASFRTHDSQAPQRAVPRSSNILPNRVERNPTSFPATKRSRSPPMLSSNQAAKGNSDDIQDDEREMLAKAKRLARFKVELGETAPNSTDAAEIRESANWLEPPGGGRSNFIPESNTELAEGFPSGNASSDYEVSGPSSVIVGLCTDMCPESERGERERKGDLDRFERLDGDRNQTSKFLAVKKYTRTAEREANLIRPMPVLQKTIAYLLDLLNKPYSDTFLATYNFLWDRMRAIRMDLRMQHIFNQGAITMLEQMIRLHILAMHELCEYSKGEGFTEGFDAHLNIEQMNKTSVELFQMYDDHRKKGIIVPSEKEFRGYYALLKLDKHPGYMVEPAELSLDLAKMTPEIRQTKEVLFARDVARACRTGNYIAFFRLVRKASYLQACLMHAHFTKLRTQALASLHAGLQNNQGLPIMHVAEWLAMEEEDIVSLLEHHGFATKDFDEPYLVKDGPFLNGDKDLDAKRSVLVDTKKSGLIYEDLLPYTEVKVNESNYKSVDKRSMAKAQKNIQIAKKKENELKDFPSVEREISSHDIPLAESSSLKNVIDEHMDDFEVISSEKNPEIMFTLPQKHEGENQSGSFSPFSYGFSAPQIVGNPWTPSFEDYHSNSFQKNVVSFEEERPLQATKTVFPDSPGITPSSLVSSDLVSQEMVTESEEEEEPEVFLEEYENKDIVVNEQREETAKAKLKLMLRLWKRHASRKKELREQKQSAANAALNSLSLGLPVQLKRDPPNISGEFDIDRALRERCRMHEKSWSRLNVSEEIADTLSRKNPDAESLYWKMILYSSVSTQDEAATVQGESRSADVAAHLWLSLKLMPPHNDDDPIASSPGLSIWKERVSEKLCFSVVRNISSDDPISVLAGASAVTFLVCDSIPWNIQKAQLQRLITSIPSGSCLPLLILSGSYYDSASDHSSIIVNELGLLDTDKSRISSFQIITLTENDQSEFSDGFLSDTQLREGLKWLASESSSQLVLQRVLTRDLVIAHLNPSLERLGTMKDTKVNPNDCVMAFNEAVDQSLLDVRTAAEGNRPNWPCPEIVLLEEASTLPESGWSSAEKIDPLMSALHNCRLPPFEDELSFLTKGSELGLEMEAQRMEFGRSLIRYLTESTQLMGFSLAMNEAEIMLQSSRLELIGSVFRIVPNWATIFRRIFNWRLTSSATSAWAYILQRPDWRRPEDVIRLPSHHLNRPSLSKMISSISPPEANEVDPMICLNDGAQEDTRACDMTEPGNWVDEDRSRDDEIRVGIGEGKRKEEADRLSELLEKCNILQNKIDAKLSVYS